MRGGLLQLAREEFERSFDPREWYEGRDDPDDGVPGGGPMWVYRLDREAGLYAVGFYTPAGEWQPDSVHGTREAAAARVHYLNGGG